MRHCALPFSHSFPASPWTLPSDLLPFVGKATNPWNLNTTTVRVCPLRSFNHRRRSSNHSPFWHPEVNLGFSPVDLDSSVGPLPIIRSKPTCWFNHSKAFNLRSELIILMLSPLLSLCRSPLFYGHGLHVKETSTLTVWVFIYLMRTLVLATFRALWYPYKELKIVVLSSLNRSYCCGICGIGLFFFVAHLPLSSSLFVFKHCTLFIISIFQTICFIVFAAIDRRDPHSSWFLKPPSPDYRTIVSRILGIVLLWVMKLAPARFISLIRLSMSLYPSTVTNQSSFELFEDDLSIYRDLSWCIALPCLFQK
ncbi:hypothetical protein AtEden1_Chr5g0135101 [Arabidopsis thaliana]